MSDKLYSDLGAEKIRKQAEEITKLKAENAELIATTRNVVAEINHLTYSYTSDIGKSLVELLDKLKSLEE